MRLLAINWSVLGLAAIVLGGCAEPEPFRQICRDPVTQACQPCKGSNACVDPVECKVTACPGNGFAQDATSTTADAGAADGKSDAAAGQTQDTATKAETADALPDLPPTIVDADSAVADSPVPTAVVAETSDCANGQLDCIGAVPHHCQSGKWLPLSPCSADLQCQKGLCGCKDPCPALNLVQCVDGVPATKMCQLTSSGCLSWNLPVACKPTEVCQLGQCQPPSTCNPACPSGKLCQGSVCIDAPCVPVCPAGQSCQAGVCSPKGGGSLSCGQIAACIGNCPVADATCPASCKGQGSDSGLGLLTAYQGCLKAVCKPLADVGKINETMLCIYTNCFKEQQACTGAGTAGCKQLSDCMAGCGGSGTCTTSCNTMASQQGGVDYYGLLTCIDNICVGLQGSAQLSCAQQGCKGGWDKCYGSGPALYSTCLQIAQCQGKCGGDATCAKACKAAGTAAAQAAVDAFVTCRDGKCGTYCANPSSPNCMPCVEIYCGNELAACSI